MSKQVKIRDNDSNFPCPALTMQGLAAKSARIFQPSVGAGQGRELESSSQIVLNSI